MSKPMNCKARQHSDQMTCECGLAWDVNDPDPPECRKGVVARQELTAMRSTLSEPKLWASKKKRLLVLQEMPLRWLPVCGIADALYQLDWPSIPEAAFVLVERPENCNAQGRDYRFFDKTGQVYIEVRRRESSQSPVPALTYRYRGGEWLTE